jgi:hypothetical protein
MRVATVRKPTIRGSARAASLLAVLCASAGLLACGSEEGRAAAASSTSAGPVASASGAGGDGGADGAGGAGGAGGSVPLEPAAFRDTASMVTHRAAHTATLLPDGRVLVVGGELTNRSMLDTVEVFDPSTETWIDGPPLSEPRSNHAAIALPSGAVLVVGGGISAPIGQPSGVGAIATALLFDPVTGAFHETAPMKEARGHFQAVLLPTGRVLVVGGGAGNLLGLECNGVPDCGPLADPLATAEIYDPASESWTQAAPMAHPRYSFSLTLLSDGRVLAVGGVDGSAGYKNSEVYDPEADAWTPGPNLAGPFREHHTALRLPSGKVMVAGGKNPGITPLESVEMFDPAGPAFSLVAEMPGPRTIPALVLLPSGRALRVGGYDQIAGGAVDEAAIYDEPTDAWEAIAPMHRGRSTQSTTVLSDGRVLVAGGFVLGFVSSRCEIAEPQ